MRILANTLFLSAIGCALLMQAFQVPQRLALFAFFCVALSAILANMMWVRSVGLIGIGGLSLVYHEIAGSHLVGTFLVAVTTALLIAAVILLVFADISYSSKGKKADEVSES